MSILGAADPYHPRVNFLLKALNLSFENIVDRHPKAHTHCRNVCESIDYNPNPTQFSGRTDDTSLPDAYLLLTPGLRIAGRGKVYWQDIAVPIEHDFSINVSDAKEKIKWSLGNILRQDACRLFAYGITVVNSEMIVWRGDRVTLLHSESLNWMRDRIMATKVFAYLAFASCGELGFDTTMRSMLLGDSKVVYDLFVDVGDTDTDEADEAEDAEDSDDTEITEDTEDTEDNEDTDDTEDADTDATPDAIIGTEIIQDSVGGDRRIRLFVAHKMEDGELYWDYKVLVKDSWPSLNAIQFTFPGNDLGPWTHQDFEHNETSAASTEVKTPRFLARVTECTVATELVAQPLMNAIYNALEVVEILWEHGFVQRDVSPTNILVVEGFAVLIDTGYTIRHHSTVKQT
ncbi:hypothetical protein FRB97_009284 [Tulasnella sp. 331]|nr:hypothetical protein FRB97_009284 [Tulasnella sp. 331]